VSGLLIAVFLRPKGKRDGREFVHLRDRQPVWGKVDRFDVGLARVTGLNSHGLELGRGIDAELLLTTRVACRTSDAQVVPFGPAE